ncbi:MAG: RNA pseudouridine synthase [Pirellulaceae bacterium]
MPPLQVLFEDNHLLAVLKPADLPTMGAAAGRESLLDVAAAYIKRKYDKPGKVYLGVVSRLDSVTTGVLLLARTSKAAARLTEQFRTGRVHKTYWAIVAGRPQPETGELHDWVVKEEQRRRMVVTSQTTPGAKSARLSYVTRAAGRGVSLLEVHLETGRKHQIRLQFSERGHAVVGDRKYGSRRSFPRGIGLHARRLALTHPVRKTQLDIVAPLPPSWREFGLNEEGEFST